MGTTLDDWGHELACEYARIFNGFHGATVQDQLDNHHEIKEWGELHNMDYNQALRCITNYGNELGILR